MPTKWNINYSQLPNYMQDAVRMYIEDGVIPGDFLRYIFQNDFVHAASHADDHNRHLLFTYAGFLYMDAPSQCWGSAAKVKEWHKQGGLNGLKNT